MEELEDWKNEKLAECAKETKEAIAMFGKLSDEMKEMHEIASPGTSMDIKTGEIHSAEKASELQTSVSHHSAGAPAGKRNITADSEKLDMLVQGTQSATSKFLRCMGHPKHHAASLIAAAVSQGPHKRKLTSTSSLVDRQSPEAKEATPTAEECEEEKANLHKVYVKTYVELSRLKNEYDELANSTACVDGTMSQYEAQKTPLQAEIDEKLKAIDIKVKALQGLRPRLESASEAEKKMREQVRKVGDECGELPETISDLGKVRDAIQALSRCPGLSRMQFHLPVWTGKWATFDQDAKTQDDKKQDELMDAVCDKQVAGSRAAEVGEIEEQTVDQIPVTNTADNPLLGACPMCEGDEAEQFASKHMRLCWQPGKGLNHQDKSKNCEKGLKSILCVVDQGDIRKIPGQEEKE